MKNDDSCEISRIINMNVKNMVDDKKENTIVIDKAKSTPLDAKNLLQATER